MLRVLIPGMDSESEEKIVNGLKEAVLFDGSNYESYKDSLYLGISTDEGQEQVQV